VGQPRRQRYRTRNSVATSTEGYPPGYAARVHTVRLKSKLVSRIRRVKGQLDAVERALSEERSCIDVIRTIAAARGAIDALAAEVVCDHLASHVAAPRISSRARASAAAELASVIRQLV